MAKLGQINGRDHMVITGEADPAAVRARVVATLRASAGGVDDEDAAEIEAVACWIEGSPNLEHALHGLALAPVTFIRNGSTTNCIRCNPTQRWIRGTPPCCPRP